MVDSEEDGQDFADFLTESHKLSLDWDADIQSLLKRAKSGDESARKQLIEGNLELAALLALRIRRIRGMHLREIDAIQEALIVLKGLVEAGDTALFAKLGPAIDSVFANISADLA